MTMFLESFLTSVPDVYLPVTVAEFLLDNQGKCHKRKWTLSEQKPSVPSEWGSAGLAMINFAKIIIPF